MCKRKIYKRFLVTEQVGTLFGIVIFAFRKPMQAVSSFIVDFASPMGGCDLGTTNGTVFAMNVESRA